jgi:hypothetical protein
LTNSSYFDLRFEGIFVASIFTFLNVYVLGFSENQFLVISLEEPVPNIVS